MSKSCRICQHPEDALVDKLLAAGEGPRSIARRVGSTSRLSLSQHRDRCIANAIEQEEVKEKG